MFLSYLGHNPSHSLDELVKVSPSQSKILSP